MADNLTPEQRRYCMSQVKGTDTSLERVVRSELHRRGWRFRKHVKQLPGKPDIVFPRLRVVVFLDGDFWHGYRFPMWRDSLGESWRKKIAETRERDQRNFRKLRRQGWQVIRIWEHEVKNNCDECIDRIERVLVTKESELHVGSLA